MASPVEAGEKSARFESLVLPHLDAAYNLARWLTGNQADAEDVVQESYLRALTFFGGFHGSDGRAWLLAIVRNTCFTWLRRNRPAHTEELEEERHGIAEGTRAEATLLDRIDHQRLHEAMEQLPSEYREVLVLREMEDLSYKQISSITGVPLGTVMSRLARARNRLGLMLRPARGGG